MEEIIEKLCKEHGTLIQVKKNRGCKFFCVFELKRPFDLN